MKTSGVLVILLVLTSGSPAGGGGSRQVVQPLTDPALTLPTNRDFPDAEAQVWSLQNGGLRAKVAARRLAKAPDHPDTLALLMETRRYDDALRVLRTIVDTRPEYMAAAFNALGFNSREMVSDAARNYGDTLRTIVADARKRKDALTHDRAAEVARALVNVESELARAPDKWRTLLAAFVAEYAGTEPALLAQVNLLTDRIGPSMFDALDAFIRDHPQTNAAASALYAKGFHLGHNASAFGERAGHDPTDRFFRVHEIFKELRSGRYPPSEWVEKAASLVAEFSTYRPAYAPGNVDRVLAALEDFLPVLESSEDSTRGSIGYIIGAKMGELYKLKGEDTIAGIEGVFDRFERRAKIPDAVKLLKAEFYLRPSERAVDPKDWPSLRAKGRSTLESLVENGATVHRRRALATLARFRFGEGDVDAARLLYSRYLNEYPESDYAWVAALRVAQCTESLGDAEKAIQLFQQAAARFDANPLARSLGQAYAGRAAEAIGDFTRALEFYRLALGSWDLDYGARYSLFSSRQWAPGQMVASIDDFEVRRDALTTRIGQLKQSTELPGGALIERGRWLIERGRWNDAIAPLSAFLSAHVSSPLAGEGRLLNHRARLELALETADADKPSTNIAAALKGLEVLNSEPPDFATCAARIALATLRFLTASVDDPDTTMAEALKAWQGLDKSAVPAARSGALERDVVEIRNAVFRPKGDGVFQSGRWNAFKWESATSPYLIVNPGLRVKSSSGEITTIVAYDPFPEFSNVLFLDAGRRAILERVMVKLGGTKRRAWTQVMETPNQPAGASLDVLSFWKKSFWAQPGHWGGWVFETYPIISEIEFIDAARTKAAVKVTVGYSGATVQMQKKNGVWTAQQLTDFWIT